MNKLTTTISSVGTLEEIISSLEEITSKLKEKQQKESLVKHEIIETSTHVSLLVVTSVY